MLYPLIRQCLFALDPERSHTLALKSLQLLYALGLTKLIAKPISDPCTIMGLYFPNRIGLAAGLDKNADYVDALAALGFGFIEIGTVTPKPQLGNPKPRLFRLPQYEAIINRMGFNNHGVDYVAKRLSTTQYRGILGVNIGKNKDTPLEKATDDYVTCFRALWQYASYITINISSPNTPGLRDLQHAAFLTELLSALKQEQKVVATSSRYIPLVVKIAPDMTDDALHDLAEVLLAQKVDGVIATNTTLDRDTVRDAPFANEAGGLSGRPLLERSTHILATLKTLLQDRIPLIASGGVMDAQAAHAKWQAGASLLQVYSGFIYKGPAIISELARSS